MVTTANGPYPHRSPCTFSTRTLTFLNLAEAIGNAPPNAIPGDRGEDVGRRNRFGLIATVFESFSRGFSSGPFSISAPLFMPPKSVSFLL